MKLLLDLGNTRLKWRLDDSEINGVDRGSAGYHELAVLGRHWTSSEMRVSHVAVSSVAAKNALEDVLAVVAGCWPDAKTVIAVTGYEMQGIKLAYANPESMGIDRALAMIGARAKREEGFLVLDGGTALTADFVDQNGQHLGGYIVPGINMLSSVLLRETAAVKAEVASSQTATFGNSTSSCVSRGVACMYAAVIKEFVGQAEQEGIFKVYATGGNADEITQAIPCAIRVDDLVLDGLAAWVAT